MRTALPLLILFAISLTPPEVSAASITYFVVNYPDRQGGYTVSGTITTNGATGSSLPGSDITSWSITITGPLANDTLDPTNTTVGASFDATPTAITVGTLGDFLRVGSSPLPGPPFILWEYQVFPPAPPFVSYGAGALHAFWGGSLPSITSPVAIVPEPSSAVLAVIGAVTVVACGLVRQRRAQRRQADAGHTQPTE
jgi:hypothetical protein